MPIPWQSFAPIPWQAVSPIPWQDFSTPGLLGLAVVAVLFGWLVPRFYYTALKAENAELRKANGELIKTNSVQAATISTLSEVGRTAGAVLNALPAAAGGGSHGTS